MKRNLTFALSAMLTLAAFARAEDIEREPINYETAPANNVISRLQKRLDANPTLLRTDDPRTFLKSMLKELGILESSQVLVFSRTSLQRQKIMPERPRAIYFNDDMYFGTCQNSNLFEVSAVDPNLGVVFYSTEFRKGQKPFFTRHNDACMNCHGSSATNGYPGHMIRSVYPDSEGYPLLSLGTFRVDQRTPIKQRWGGWYVTGTSGKQTHLGNRIFKGDGDRDVVETTSLNRDRLDEWIEPSRYLHGHSDIVALMVMEHQAEMQNLLTKAAYQTRIGVYQDRLLNKEIGKPEDEMSATTWRRIQNAGEQVVAYMLFSNEAPITDTIRGSSSFATNFAAAGKRDAKGRSLRDFDLNTRLFKYPCSYLIDSEQFEGLPGEVKEYVLKRLYAVLKGRDSRPQFAHLSADDRQAILEILRETKPSLPAYWRE